MGQALLSAFDVVTGLFKDPAVNLASAAITKKVDGGVEAGVYALSADALPATLKGSGLQARRRARGGRRRADAGARTRHLCRHRQHLRQAVDDAPADRARPVRRYKAQVYALDHPTMGESPIANALTLVRALPAGARMHLVTHSRGGLVAEVLARACGGGASSPVELEFFADDKYTQHRTDLQALVKMAQAKGLKVERVVRVACPARGTTLASKRFDAYLSVLQWGLQLAGVPVAPQLVDFLHEVARRRADPSELPGIEAMMPESAVAAWLNRGEQSLPGRAARGGRRPGRRLDRFVGQDAVVRRVLLDRQRPRGADPFDVRRRPARRRRGRRYATGAPGGASFLLDRGGKVTHFNYFANDSTVNAIVERAARGGAGWLCGHRSAVMGRAGSGRHACGQGRGALARRSRRLGHRGRSPGRVRTARHPRLEPQARRQAHLARLPLRQWP